MELWGLRCTAGSGARWGPPAPMGAPATAPVPLCLGSSCCSWAGSTSPVYCSASVPSSIRATKVGQTLLWGGWRGGGCTTPERRRRKEEGRRRKIRCLCPKLPTLLQPSLPRQQPTGTSPRSVLFTSSTRISAGKLPPPAPFRLFLSWEMLLVRAVPGARPCRPRSCCQPDPGLCLPWFVGVPREHEVGPSP